MKILDIIKEEVVLDRPPVKQPKEIELDKPGGFNIVLLNDNITPYEVVLEALQSVLELSRQSAYERMMRAHRGGWHVVATYASSDVAETMAERLMDHCRSNTNYDYYRRDSNDSLIPRYPHGPRGYHDPWPTTFEVMEAGG